MPISKKWIGKIVAGVMAILFLYIGYIEIEHRYNYGHFVGFGLHIDVKAEDCDIGIHGINKMYKAELLNMTLLPIKLDACNYLTDAFAPGTEYPYAVQRWDAESNNWQTVSVNNGQFFCCPAPLSKIQAVTVHKTLYPFHAIQIMEGEATGAREPFNKGDQARFVVFRRISDQSDWHSGIVSPPFIIQDQIEESEGTSFRVKH